MKTVFYSELLHKYFEDEESCKKAEQEYNEKHSLEIKKKEERTKRAKEVNAAFEKYIEDYKEYCKLKDKFIKDYGEFHMTYRDGNIDNLDDVDFEPLFKLIRSVFF